MAALGACGTRRRRHLSSTCCRVGFLRRGTRLRRRDDDADYISALPDDLLLQILGRLGCARAAANTSLLSRRWRGLWARSPALYFHMITPDQLHAALGRIVPPAGSLRIFIPGHHMLSPSRISSLLAAAAPLAPAELAVDFHTDKRFRSSSSSSDADGVELPCLDRTTSLTLHFSPRVRLPPAGQFTALESLSFGGCHIALGELLPRCPFLRKLCLSSWRFDSLAVHSPSLQELDVSAAMQLQCVDIVVPMLKKLKFRALEGINNASSISLSAPLVDDLSWLCLSRSKINRFGVIWLMWSLEVKTPEHLVHTQLTNSRENTHLQPQHRPRGHILSLDIVATPNLGRVARPFEQEISRIPVRNISVLELNIATGGHVYGAMVLDLLQVCTSIKKLEVKLNGYKVREECSVNCHCDQPNNWKDQIVSLTGLKEVEIDGFKGEDHEVSLLKVLLMCAAMLETVSINLSRNVPRSCCAYLELPRIFVAHASVKFNIYL